MKHDLTAEGYAFRLRPITLADAATIVDIRLKDPYRNRFIHPISSDPAEQVRWLMAYFEREGDYYFVVENKSNNQPAGLVGVYDIDREQPRWAEWGRWVSLPRSRAGTESVWLIYRVAFEQLHLDLVYCRTVVDNARAVSFHDSYGLERSRTLPRFVQLNDKTYDVIEHRLTRDNWPAVALRLGALALAVSKEVT